MKVAVQRYTFNIPASLTSMCTHRDITMKERKKNPKISISFYIGHDFSYRKTFLKFLEKQCIK